MEIKKMFYKEIDRDIKGVIKIGQDDKANVKQELEEYVVTRELASHLDTFFQAYKKSINNYTDKMGIWISGFFGSGKSHLLKIVSYLLENKDINGKKAISYFDDKIEDAMAFADMQKVASMGKHTDVILFNIDSKADATSKSNKDAIVQVFMKVFNEMQGFCASMPWLADLERQMTRDGSYEDFKRKFKDLSGNEWTSAREDFYFEEDNIIEALSSTTKMSEESARNWFNKAEENYSLSIEKFAQRVNEYIKSKGEDHHLVFLADEIGQYIGDDVGLMLNLQTLVEDLGTHCKGKVWVIVTSQQDIDSITKVKGNDFSKIQGRFNTRLNLSSANVDEVIKKRILRKTEAATSSLRLKYQDKESILKNLITFSTDTAEMKTYQNEEDFAQVYPFIPYQFNLLQSVFTGIRLHGASGKHLSEGERSLLSAFQESAIKYMEENLGILIPFSAFYETVEAFLDSNIRSVFLKAEDNQRLMDHDIEALKLLFLIKYVKEIPSNIENIATLMVTSIDQDKIELKKKIEESLKRLLKETLIQKNGNEYIFLTHEEQDVNREIQHISIDMGDTILKIGEQIFEGIYKEKRYKYNTKYHFDFNRIIDDRLLSSQKSEIGIKIITPYYDTGVDLTEQELKMMSSRENNLIVKLPMDTTFLEEMEDILKIQTYIRRKGGSRSTLEIEEIKIRKSREATDKEERVTNLLIEALKTADLYVNSQKLDIRVKNPLERINEGFKLLVESIYSKLNYISGFIESNKDLNDILLEDSIQVKLVDDTPNKLAVDEINNYIERNTERNIPMTLRSIISLYEKAPYGWKDMDIRGIILRLFKDQELRLELASEYLTITDKNLIDYLTKKDYQDRLLVKKRIKTPIKYINNVRDLAKEVFEVTALPSDEDGLMKRFKDLCKGELKMRNVDTNDYGIQFLIDQYQNNIHYPGKDVLEKGEKLFEEIIQIKDVKEFYERVYDLKDDLLDYEEDVFDIKKFFKNQRGEFDKALRQLNIYEKNKTYVVDLKTREIIGQIDKIIKSKEPYTQIHRLPSLVDEFIGHFAELLEIECGPIRTVIENDSKMVLDEVQKYGLNGALEDRFRAKFDDLLKRLDSANNFYEAIAMKEESDRIKIRCFEEIEKEKAKVGPKPDSDPSQPASVNQVKSTYKARPVKNISITNILHGAKIIETPEDIDEVLGQIKRVLLDQLGEDNKLKLI